MDEAISNYGEEVFISVSVTPENIIGLYSSELIYFGSNFL